jgi:predicted DNA binding CopG/RHH family protein
MSREKQAPGDGTGERAERLVETADLPGNNLSRARPVPCEIAKQDTPLNMRRLTPSLAAVKGSAERRAIPYRRLVRETLEPAVTRKWDRSLRPAGKADPARRSHSI